MTATPHAAAPGAAQRRAARCRGGAGQGRVGPPRPAGVQDPRRFVGGAPGARRPRAARASTACRPTRRCVALARAPAAADAQRRDRRQPRARRRAHGAAARARGAHLRARRARRRRGSTRSPSRARRSPSSTAATRTPSAASAEDAGERCLVISDTSWPGYEDVPRWVVDGYATIFSEIDEAIAEQDSRAPDLVALPIGVGALAAAGVRTTGARGEPRPRWSASSPCRPRACCARWRPARSSR